jgi:GNAT superfamily N-acetyltransferase
VAEHDGRRAGHAALTGVGPDDPATSAWSDAAGRPPERLSCLTRLFVALGARGAGGGAALLDTAVEHAPGEGRTAVLEVSPADGHAVALYRRHGWRPVGSGPPRWWVPVGGTSLLFLAPAER